jgi:hypothetical protein
MRYLYKFCVFSTIILLLASCTEPSPLYGTWADNRGDKLSFFDDDTFNASFLYSGVQRNYDGNYSVLLNSLTFNCSNGNRIVSEWDIRGNMLYLNWTYEDSTVSTMTLYKISN